MIDVLTSYDRAFMVWLNIGNQHCAGLDFFFWMVSQIVIWVPVFLAFLYTIVKSKKKEAFLIAGIVILLFLLCDQISSSLLKPLIARPRPSHDPLVESLLSYVYDYRGGPFGFPSSHAANSFGFATFSALLLRHKGYSCCALLWACLCSYSRIYLGVHFPGDIVCGTLLGIGIAFICYFLYTKLKKRFIQRFNISTTIYSQTTCTGFYNNDIHLIQYTLGIILFTLMCTAIQIH